MSSIVRYFIYLFFIASDYRAFHGLGFTGEVKSSWRSQAAKPSEELRVKKKGSRCSPKSSKIKTKFKYHENKLIA
jgi:hypothetical protein